MQNRASLVDQTMQGGVEANCQHCSAAGKDGVAHGGHTVRLYAWQGYWSCLSGAWWQEKPPVYTSMGRLPEHSVVLVVSLPWGGTAPLVKASPTTDQTGLSL